VALTLNVVHRLFEPFQRLDRTRVDDHHGLGLSIVRAIAITHDATLTANVRRRAASR
jgi:signal transduction histidine kinase